MVAGSRGLGVSEGGAPATARPRDRATAPELVGLGKIIDNYDEIDAEERLYRRVR